MNNIEKVVSNILTKVAAKKEEEKKKEDKKPIKETDTCKYASTLADVLDEVLVNFDFNFGSPIEQALAKTAYDSPNTLSKSEAPSTNFKSKNEHVDVMAKGEDPAKPNSPIVKAPTTNHLETTIKTAPGGGEKPKSPPLMNKAASAYDKVLAKLSYESPNHLEHLSVEDSGKGQQGWDGSGFENAGRSLITERPMTYDKADAKKEYIQKSMSQVFDSTNPSADTATRRFIDKGQSTSKLAGLEDAKKLKAIAEKEVKEEKEEEKVSPGIHDKIEKEASECTCNGKGTCEHCKEKAAMKKAASILLNLKLAGMKENVAGKVLGGADGVTTKAHDAVKNIAGKATSVGNKAKDTVAKHQNKAIAGTAGVGLGASFMAGRASKKEKTAQEMPMDPSMGGAPVDPMQQAQDPSQQIPPDQIEKMKKILLMLQLKKQQEEAVMQQQQGMPQMGGQMPPEMTAPMGGVQ